MFTLRQPLLAAALLLATHATRADEVLVWQDEFNGTSLDATKWTPEVGFTRNERAAQIYRADRLSVRGGALYMTATHSAKGYPNPYKGRGNPTSWLSTRPSANYASGAVNSLGKLSMRYGRVEIRAKYNIASGAWPALWMIGTLQDAPTSKGPVAFWRAVTSSRWPQCGEIDILEYATRDDAAHAANARRTVWSTFHWGDSYEGKAYRHIGKTIHVENLDQASLAAAPWHRYGMQWTPDRITLTCDDQPVISMATADMCNGDGRSPFRENYFHFIMNLALGSMANQPPADGKGYPISHAIDYVRIWQDPTIPGNGLRVQNRERTFAHLTANDPAARVLIPTDARESPKGDLTTNRTPLYLGGFRPTPSLTLTCTLTLPKRPGGTLLALAATDGTSLQIVRRSGHTYALCNVKGNARRPRGTPFTLPPGRHTLTLTTTPSGTTLLCNGQEVFTDATLTPAATLHFITLGGAPTSTTATPIRGLRLHTLDLRTNQ